ncbi:MAG TPA: DUF711 family protein [Anaerolineales bacterium]|nr:DUF711 family protein [Anaerolineales bacterium]
MKIRSITYFLNPKYPLDENALRKAGEFLAQAKSAYEAAGYEVQTTRLATVPFPRLLAGKIDETPRFAQKMSEMLQQIGVAYAALGPALIEFPESYAVIPEAISSGENIFFGGVIADRKNGISLQAIRACAKIIQQASTITPDGFGNLRFAALANVKAGAPFFPAAYHDSDEPAFAVATESADLAVEAFANTKSLEDGRNNLISEITKHGQAIARMANTELSNTRFIGIDFSLAPFPDDAHSLGGAVENMGISKVGLHGSLAAAAILTEAVDRADFPHTGFSGFMQPVLEDSILAKRAAEGTLTIKDALLYSAVCGTGLDTVPLPGDTTAEQLAPLLLDLSALAMRLDKPLTARLMPVPGKKAGDATNFDFAFFANSRVMALNSAPLNFPLGGEESFSLQPKRSNI